MKNTFATISFLIGLTICPVASHAQESKSNETPLPTVSDLDGQWIWYGPAGIGELTFADGRQVFQLVLNDGSRPWNFEIAIEVSSHEGISFLTHRNDEGNVTYRGIFKLTDGHFYEIPPQIRAGANRTPELRDWRRAGGEIDAFLKAARLGKTSDVKRMLDDGITPDTTVGDSLTALAYAAAGGHVDAMQLLIDRGADVKIRSGYWGNSAVDQAVRFEQIDAARLLLKHGASLKSQQPIGHTGVRNYIGNSTLHELAHSGNAKCLELLLEAGADINAQNLGQKTPLMIAVLRSRNRKGELSDKHIEITKRLLSKNADKTLTDNDGKTAFDYASERKLEALLQLLQP